MEFMSLDSVGITLRSDGMCMCHFPHAEPTGSLMSWFDSVIDHLATELTIDRLMAHLLAGGSI